MSAARKALVQNAGQIQQLQAGDFLDNTALASSKRTNDNAGSIVICSPVYVKSNGHVDLAKADASATSRAFGLVLDTSIATTVSGYIQAEGILTATTGQWDAVAGTSGGLAAGTVYYLSAATAGLLTATPPSTVGQSIVEIGQALSTTELKITPSRPILL